MNRILLWLLGLLTLLWAYFIFGKVVCPSCNYCQNTAAALPAAAQEKSKGPLTYDWSKDAAVTGDDFASYKSGVLANRGVADTLVVTGQYRADETNNTEYENLGLARAHAAKALFLDRVPESRIRLSSELVSDGVKANSTRFSSVNFSWIDGKIDEKAATIIESGNSTTILFPFGSAIKDRNVTVDAYLASLCEKYGQNENVKFLIEGHTDDVGDAENNKSLGMKRAMFIRETFRNCGVDRDRIEAVSYGEEKPIADNNTESGRHQNRRVVITIENNSSSN